jgi:hypothetical protein
MYLSRDDFSFTLVAGEEISAAGANLFSRFGMVTGFLKLFLYIVKKN